MPENRSMFTLSTEGSLYNSDTGELIGTCSSPIESSLTVPDCTPSTTNSESEQLIRAYQQRALNATQWHHSDPDVDRDVSGVRFQMGYNHKCYINQFNYNPDQFHFHKVNNEEELYMGVELEIDGGNGNNNDIAKHCIDMLNESNIYCKHDGSLQSGFEIVTHPCTYDYHKQLSYQNLFEFLVKENYKSHNTTTCGLHVHFNKNYFGKDKLHQDLNIGKLLYILEKFWEKVVLVARRDSNRFSRRFNLNEDETILDMYAKSKNSDKYGAVNLQHKNSFEIRIFKGTLNYDTFINTLEFVDKMVKYIRQIDIYEIQMVTWDDISANFSDNLNEYIADREEKEKNKPKPKSISESISQQMMRGHMHRTNPSDFYMGLSTGRNHNDQIGDAYVGGSFAIDSSSLADATAQWSMELSNSFMSESTLLSNEETALRRRIQDLRQQERRERNHMAQTTIRREISELERRLNLVRRQRVAQVNRTEI